MCVLTDKINAFSNRRKLWVTATKTHRHDQQLVICKLEQEEEIKKTLYTADYATAIKHPQFEDCEEAAWTFKRDVMC